MDLTLAIALMNAYNRLAISFRATPGALAKPIALADTLHVTERQVS